MRNRHIITALLMLVSLTSHAADTDSTLVEHTGLWQRVGELSCQNPALHGIAYRTTFSQLYLQADWQHQSLAFIPEKGDGYLLPAAHVDTYLRLNDHSTAWGHASYMNGQQRHIRWNSTSDYDLLEPYILADTVGGDTQHERYVFEGGYALHMDSWLIGAEMLFRADHEYRDIDPRMRGIANELILRLGASRQWCHYHWAFGFEGSVYKQRNTVEFYRELGVVPEYQMTGLGTDYARFSGDKRALQYDGGGVRLLFDVTPQQKDDFFAHLALGESRYHRMVTENYILPLTDLYTHSIEGRAGLMGPLSVYADISYTTRSGDEHIIGTSATTSFPDLGVLTMYKNHRVNTSLTTIYAATHWQIETRVGYQSDRQTYAYPERCMNSTHAFVELTGMTFHKPTNQMLLTCVLTVAHRHGLSSDLTMPFANMSSAFIEKARHTYAFAKADYTDLLAHLRCDYQLKDYGLFASMNAGYTTCSADAHQLSGRLSIGITF